MRFRFDINALRAIAVTSVVLFHLKMSGFSGGFIGVDIFFVISGYLMTNIVISSIDKQTFSLINFYEKRVKRIIPALLVLVMVISSISFFLFLPNDYQTIEKNATSSLLFLSNILYWKTSGYFAQASDNNVFLHTWSLSVEWQFYLLYPLLLLLLKKVSKSDKLHLLILSIIFFLSLSASLYLTVKSPVASFYLLPTRAWEMLTGGIVFFSQKRIVIKSKFVSIFSYVIILVAIFWLDSKLLWPGWFTLMPVIATAFVILSDLQFPLLKNPVIQFLGKTSYSFYLWHWPVIVISQYLGVPNNPVSIITLASVSLLLAYLSFRFVESRKEYKSKKILASLVIVSMGTGLLSYFEVNRFVFKDETIAIAEYQKNHSQENTKQFSLNLCFSVNSNDELKSFNKAHCLKLDSLRKNFLLVGDSHAAALSSSLREELENHEFNLLQATSSGCFPLLFNNGTNSFCNELFNYIFKSFIPSNKHRIDGVILCGNWHSYEDDEKLAQSLADVIQFVEKQNIPVLIIGQNEVYTVPFPIIAAKEAQYSIKGYEEYLKNGVNDVNILLKQVCRENYIDVYNKVEKKLNDNKIPYMLDNDHFSKYGADIITGIIFHSHAGQDFFNRSNVRHLNLIQRNRK